MAVDIHVIGGPELERKLKRLADKMQKSIARKAVRNSAKRTHVRIVANITRLQLIDTGILLASFSQSKIRSSSRRPRDLIRIGPEWPYREDLGISPDDPYYYPMAVEFGHARAPAHPFVRPAIDEHKTEEWKAIANEIGQGVEAAAKL